MQREIEPAITGKTTSMRTDYLYCSVNVKTVRDAFTVNVHLVCVCVCVCWGGGGGGVGGRVNLGILVAGVPPRS